ncbi:hypothetical protein [Marinilabilia sp.]|uniref:hypothetical protein n=1 Tax=Marinilabilia sp. TaxID=2021252 RepID=UPI0025C555A2|nr:hypothetical protein [Marinilabilia sp.]
MTIRTFWTLLLKALGIWLVLNGLTVITQFISFFSFFGSNHNDNILGIIYVSILLLITIGAYFIVLKIFVFNSNWIIDKLKLDKGFQEDKIDLNISLRTVLKIAIIVIGGLIFVEAFPMLCKQIFSSFQQKEVFREDPQFSWVIFYFVKVCIGYLMMTKSNYLIDFIQKKTDKTKD